uniref:UDP-N-acetylglucosamine--dolichyl-phosphate N-acetylglucosaminephosphotransferase n=1 Tax=Metchnikovella dogieli TaxID=2804710 RepID=A0A896WN67_9MICR|nr:UDP-N-acetylglucosamine-dolichyl-phosphate N-acetylglucosaminephosphotransferase [Metchnikovella dogieli]
MEKRGAPLKITAFLGGIFFLTDLLIPKTASLLVARCITGIDLNKEKRISLPEGMGLVCSLVHVSASIFAFFFIWERKNRVEPLFSSISAFLCAIFGFIDDIISLRWRNKLFLPLLAAVPFLLVFDYERCSSFMFIKTKRTRNVSICIFHFLCVLFAAHSINILAGINGLEITQSFIISSAAIILKPLERNNKTPTSTLWILLFTSGCLLKYNLYPARVFVGDSYCFFAGMIIANGWLMQGYPPQYILFIFPQLINFLLSIPQLLSLYPCPKHRMPCLSADTKLLEKSSHNGKMNLTLLNILLFVVKVDEKTALVFFALIQATCCLIGLYLQSIVDSRRIFSLIKIRSLAVKDKKHELRRSRKTACNLETL